MAELTTQRFYPIPNLDFRDFWDICVHYKHVHPEYKYISYTIDGQQKYIVLEESDISVILKKLSSNTERIRKYVARFFTAGPGESVETGSSELIYRPTAYDEHQPGLYFYSDNATKLTLYHFEDLIYNNYEIVRETNLDIEFGQPCEVLAAAIDMRGFSKFCEEPNIESPYTCGLMSAFYSMVRNALFKYPPELIKFMGDGVLAVWHTGIEDRQVAIDVCIEGCVSLHNQWQMIRKGKAEFTHGAPEDIGAGISFGLASKVSFGNDYIGRPINIASRLCGVCPGARVYVDRSIPKIPPQYSAKESKQKIKSYGQYNVWSLEAD